MSRIGRMIESSFGAALLGGAVVAIAGLAAIEAGLIEAEGSDPAAEPTPPTRPVADGAGLSVNQIYERDANGVVFIRAQREQPAGLPFDPFGQGQGGTATGSGFVIDGDGHIVTNAHVVEGAERVEVMLSADGEPRRARLVGSDPSTDLALLAVEDTEGLRALELGDSAKVEVGDPVVAIGNPFGLDRTVTTGIVSALQREISAPNGFSISDVIQTDAAINPGNSGGPLIDSAGRVIGVNSQIATSGGGSEGVGFAVPIDTVREVVAELRDDGTAEHAYLGITGADLNPGLARALNLSVEAGVVVERVLKDSPAAKAGLRGSTAQTSVDGRVLPSGGDVIVEVDGRAVEGMTGVIAAVDAHDPGDELTLTVLRAGEERELTVTLGDRPESS